MDNHGMKPAESQPAVHPLYVLVMAVLGGVIGWGLFQWNYSPPLNADGVLENEFWVWLFLIMCFMALLAIFALPMWAIFIDLFKKQVLRDKNGSRRSDDTSGLFQPQRP